MKNIIFENFRGKNFPDFFFRWPNFFSPNAPKTSKTRKTRFLRFRKFWNFGSRFLNFSICYHLWARKKNSLTYDFFETFFTYSEAHELSDKIFLLLWENFSIYRKIDLKFSRFRIFGVLGVRNSTTTIYHRTHAGADPRIEATVFCVKVFKMRLRREKEI